MKRHGVKRMPRVVGVVGSGADSDPGSLPFCLERTSSLSWWWRGSGLRTSCTLCLTGSAICLS